MFTELLNTNELKSETESKLQKQTKQIPAETLVCDHSVYLRPQSHMIALGIGLPVGVSIEERPAQERRSRTDLPEVC